MKRPYLGQIVIYNTSEEELKKMCDNPNCNQATKLPAVVTAVWSEECVNLKVLKDGEGEIWKTSAQPGTGEHQWQFIEEA